MRKVYIFLLALGVVAGAPWALTQAVWSDSQDVGSNTFSSGSVDLSAAPTSAIVSLSNMAPGDSVTDDVVVTNAGTVQLRYAVSETISSGSSTLASGLTLDIKTIDVTTPGTPCDDFDGTSLYGGTLAAGNKVGDPTQGSQSGDRTLNASANETLCFRVQLPSNAANSLQSLTVTASFSFAAEQTANN